MESLLMNILRTYYLLTFMSIMSFYLNTMSNKTQVHDPIETLNKLDKEIEQIKNEKIKKFARAYFGCNNQMIIHLSIILVSMIPILHLLFFIMNFIELLSDFAKKED